MVDTAILNNMKTAIQGQTILGLVTITPLSITNMATAAYNAVPVDTLLAQIAALQADKTTLQGQVATLTGDKATLTAQLATAQNDCAMMKASSNAMAEDLARNQAILDKLSRARKLGKPGHKGTSAVSAEERVMETRSIARKAARRPT